MVEAMHSLVLWAMKVVIQKSLSILVNYDEVTTVDNHNWLSIHLYVIDGWKQVPILLMYKGFWMVQLLLIWLKLLCGLLLSLEAWLKQMWQTSLFTSK